MFEEFSRRNRVVIAAMSLAATHDWGDITLADIAREAKLNVADLRRDFSCKSDILRTFQEEVDAQVLATVKPAGPDESVRDRVFETLMSRFDVLTPYKIALKHITSHLRCRPGEASLLVCSGLTSQYWTLSSAGAKLEGASALVRVAGLSAVYSQAFKVWLEDDSQSLDKTMATLDRGLNNGERALKRMEKACGTLCGFVRGLKRNLKPNDGVKPDPSTDSGPVPSSA